MTTNGAGDVKQNATDSGRDDFSSPCKNSDDNGTRMDPTGTDM